MNGNNLLLDTNIIIYLLNGDLTLKDMLFERELYVSFITELELLSYKGLSEEEKQRIEKFLDACFIVDINEVIKLEVIKVRSRYNCKLPDAIIAGTSIFLNIPMVTADKAFLNIEELSVLHYQ